MKRAIVFFNILLMSTNMFSQQFTEIETGMMVSTSPCISWGDYDNDMDLDVLITSNENSYYYSKIYRNDGQNDFTEINANLLGVSGYSSSAWCDFDNDGDLDLALSGRVSGPNRQLVLYRNMGNDTFIELNYSFTGVDLCSIIWNDYDNDGDYDLLVCGDTYDGEISIIIKNNGNCSFSETYASFPAVERCSIDCGDYDNDGDSDIILSGACNNGPITKIFRNDGNGNYTDLHVNLIGVYRGDVKWGDFNSDGLLDFCYSGIVNVDENLSRIYRNDGNNTFVNINAEIEDIGYSINIWGDYDNDGDLDFCQTGALSYNPEVANIYKNVNNTFEYVDEGIRATYTSSYCWGDFDNDGDLDIIGGSLPEGRNTSIFKNNALTANTKPQAPTNLSSDVQLDTVWFAWDKATDNETAQNGLGYNIRIGTAPDGIDIVTPMADLENGYRRIPDLGNCSISNQYKIFNLKPGKYYWSVQTIDNAYAGSDFSTSSTFIVPHPIEFVSDDVTQLCEGESFHIDFVSDREFLSNNIFSLQLSGSDGSFASPVVIGTLKSSDPGRIYASIPDDIEGASGYRMRIVSSNPAFTGEVNANGLTIYDAPDASFDVAETSLCPFAEVTYTANTTQDCSYNWTVTGGEIEGSNTYSTVDIVWGDNSSGTVTLELENEISGCQSASAQVINIHPIPDLELISGSLTPCMGDIIEYKYKLNQYTVADWKLTKGNIEEEKGDSLIYISWPEMGSGRLDIALHNPVTGCSNTITYDVKISLPIEAEIAGDTTAVTGSIVQYGAAESNNRTNKWTAQNGVIVGSDTSKVCEIQWQSSGKGTVYLVQYSDSSDCSALDSMIVDIFKSDSVTISGDTQSCAGQRKTYSANISQGTPISWSAQNGEIIGSDDQYIVSINWNTPGYGYVKALYVSSPGADPDSVIKNVEVFESPSVTMTAFEDVCLNDAMIVLDKGTPAGGVYSGSGVQGNMFDPMIAGLGTHEIEYIYMNNNGCADSAVADITVHEVPETPTINRVPGSLTLLSSSATNNEWYFNNNIISGANEQYYIADKNGWYKVRVFSENNCYSDFSDSLYVVDTTDVAYDIANAAIIVRSSNHQLSISFTEDNISNYSISCYSELGNTIAEQKGGLTSIGNRNIVLNIPERYWGPLFIMIISNDKTYFIKEFIW